MDIKVLFAILSAVIGQGALVPYIIDTVKRRTEPHAYTWIIWAITQTTAGAASLYGGGGWGAKLLFLGGILCFVIFLLSLKYGTKNITKSDTIVLIAAISAIFVWWQLNQPLIAVIMITLIDFIGYFPTFRKSWQEPWSETVISWFGFFFGMLFAILAIDEYNSLTLIYPLVIALSNITVAIICILRRRYIFSPHETA